MPAREIQRVHGLIVDVLRILRKQNRAEDVAVKPTHGKLVAAGATMLKLLYAFFSS
jgi:hypothetical protein